MKAFACKFLNIPLDIINPKTVLKIPNEGFPYVQKIEIDDPDNVENDCKKIVDVPKSGDMFVRFNIKFPSHLSIEQREKMIKVLRNEDEE